MSDLRIIGNENLTLEMYIMQLIHLKNIDQIKEISTEPHSNGDSILSKKPSSLENDDSDDAKITSVYKNQLKNVDQIKTSPELQSEALKPLLPNWSLTKLSNSFLAPNTPKAVLSYFERSLNISLAFVVKSVICF